ncbi:MAG: PEGA domain-containing protein [Deltaproteobacteria bacterium]|nr:PEGA domain-containing protein [Deltaproteobacteria bacterium]
MRQAQSNLLTRVAVLATLLLAFGLSATSAHAAVPTTPTNIDTVPTGAQVFLVAGGQETFQGVTPMKLFRLPRGTIQLKFKKEGHDDLLQTIGIATTRQTLLFNLVRTIQPATIELTSAPEFSGAAIEIDGKAIGPIPSSAKVSPGRHQVVVTKDGYGRWERWIEATEGQRVTFDVVLVKSELPKGEILVSSNPSGASIMVNGAPRGVTPAVIEGLTPGPYLVEVSLADYTKASQSVVVEAGQRAKIDLALQKVKGDTGEIKILTDVDDAQIFLDGELIGKAPVTQANIRPGTHQVEARTARGFSGEATAEVRAGEMTVVRIKMTQTSPPDKGQVRVISTAPGADASLDGGEFQKLPTTFSDVAPGSHVITVRAAGFANWTRTIQVTAGSTEEVVAELGQSGRVEVSTKDGTRAELFLNGKPLGRTPFTGEVPAGTHSLLVQRDDGKQEEFQIAVGVDRVVKVTAAFGADKPQPQAVHRPMPFSARALSQGTGHASIVASWPGWPFPLYVQAGGGVGWGFDVNVQFRTAFDVINEFEGIVKWTFADIKTLSAAVELGIGGGLGGNDRNSFVLRPRVKGSLMIGENAAITAHVGLLYHTDRLGPEDKPETKDRDAGLRLYLGLDLEFRVAEKVNLMFSIQGDPVGGKRALYEESFLDDPDPKLYFSGGVSFMF